MRPLLHVQPTALIVRAYRTKPAEQFASGQMLHLHNKLRVAPAVLKCCP